MEANVFCGAVLHPIVQLLVVAEVKTLLLEFPLQFPVSLGDKQKSRMLPFDGSDDLNPILRFRSWPSPPAPSALENRIRHQHCHVTANAIALLSDAIYGLNRSLSKAAMEGVQLQHIRPSRKIGVSSACADCPTDLNKGRGIIPCVAGSASDEVLRVIRGPRMVGCDMIGDKVQQ